MMESSHYERLPIYKAAMDLVVNLDGIVRGFSRYHKYSIGSQLRNESLLLADLIMQANVREARAQKIPELCRHVERMKLLCNAAKEVKAWKSFKQFMQVMEQVVVRQEARKEQVVCKDHHSKVGNRDEVIVNGRRVIQPGS